MRKVCIDCYRIHQIDQGLLEPIDEKEDSDSESEISDLEPEPPIDPFYDPRYDDDDNGSMDSEEREHLWELYWYRMENFADL